MILWLVVLCALAAIGAGALYLVAQHPPVLLLLGLVLLVGASKPRPRGTRWYGYRGLDGRGRQ